jgi:hypothetical protein
MKYIIFSIDNHIEEFLFIIEYTKGENRNILGELIKLNNFCHIKDFDFDFFEVTEDPSIALSKQGIYIYKYNSFTDVINRLNIKLMNEDIKDLKIINKDIFHIMLNKNRSEIMSIIHNKEGKYYELLKKLFEAKKNK